MGLLYRIEVHRVAFYRMVVVYYECSMLLYGTNHNREVCTMSVDEYKENEQRFTWMAPSNVGDKYNAHHEALTLCQHVPVGKAFAVTGNYDLKLLRKIAELYKPKKIVVIQHTETQYEVRRVDGVVDLALFYSTIEPEASKAHPGNVTANGNEGEVARSKELYAKLKQYFSTAPHELAKYCTLAHKAVEYNVVSYSYLQRRLNTLACYRKAEGGGSNALKGTIQDFIEAGILTELAGDETEELFSSKAVCYRINRNLLEGNAHEHEYRHPD